MANQDRTAGKGLGRTTPASIRTPDVEAAFRSNYPRYQYCFVDYFAEQLADFSRVFHGDLQMVVLLATIGQISLSAAIAAETGGRAVSELPPERRGMTTHRLADCTGIPRETVRRKLLAMERKGWLVREHNFWFLTPSGDDTVARKDLAGLDDRAIARTARLYTTLARLVVAATPT